MRLTIAAVILFALLLPGQALAATVGGKTRERDGTTFGTMRYVAEPRVDNRVTVEPVTEFVEFRITDRAEPLRALGDCRQAGRHSAICPWTESDFAVLVKAGSGDDRVEVKGRIDAKVRGGIGNDVLLGNGDALYGDRGHDRLRGGRDWDRLHGGPGRDRMDGRGGSRFLDDVFYDDETDAQAARDVMIGGRNARARVDYSKRRSSLRIDLHRRRIAPEGDLVSGVKSVTGGWGDDVLVGTGGPNTLEGGPGRDRLDGRLGDDTLDGGPGDDVMLGGDGDDRLSESISGSGGRDRFVGGRGADQIESLDGLTLDATLPDDVRCDGGDRPVQSDPRDRLRGCATVAGWDIGELELRVQPRISDAGATFRLRCGVTEMEQTDPSTFIKRCRGVLTVRSSGGEELGSQAFVFEMDDYRTPEVEVTVPLTAAGLAAIRRGTVIEVEADAQSANGWRMPPAGYRAFVAG